ncbi:MAG: anti-sigma factor antagonist [Sumerlaeia bacterium]
MDIQIYQNSDKILVQLSGRVVLDECDRLKSAVVPRIVPGVAQVNLDLSKVEFIDSAGLGVLVGMKVSSNKSRSRLALVSPSKSVSDILTVSKLDAIFDILTGAEAKAVLQSLARPEFKADGTAGDTSGPPAPPSSPTFHAPPPTQPTVGPDASTLSPKEMIDRYCKDAVDFMRQRDYENAAACYKKALGIDEQYLPAHNNLAIVYEKNPATHQQAIEQWKRVLEISRSRNDDKHVDRAQKHLEALGGV